MDNPPSQALLSAKDPSPVRIVNAGGSSPFLLVGDHAGNAIPARLSSFGIGAADMVRHIAWDIGVAALGKCLAATLDATFISQRYSRLVIDCNRDPDAIDAMPAISDGTPLPRNENLDAGQRAARVAAIHMPYHAAIAAELARRDAEGQDTVLVALHSFTPQMRGERRPWQIGILHGGGNESFSDAVLSALQTNRDLTIGDNEPYAMDLIDYTVPRHAFAARRRYVETEIRQDLLATDEQVTSWCERLSEIFRQSY